jgi:hypothetical protein
MPPFPLLLVRVGVRLAGWSPVWWEHVLAAFFAMIFPSNKQAEVCVCWTLLLFVGSFGPLPLAFVLLETTDDRRQTIYPLEDFAPYLLPR